MTLAVQDETNAVFSPYARVLLLGPSKSGKTTSIAGSAPRPFVINCDGPSAPSGAIRLGAKFPFVSVSNPKEWREACELAVSRVRSGETETVIVDTVSLLVELAMLPILSEQFQGWDVWRELDKQVMTGVKLLMAEKCHLFVISHLTAGQSKAEGILPSIGGKLKVKLPALLDDWILLEVQPGKKPERVFLLGPQGEWAAAGRNIRRSCMIEANVPELFAELGIGSA